MDPELKGLIDKIGSSGVVVADDNNNNDDDARDCHRCRKPIEGEPKRVTDRYDNVTRWHPECWSAYAAEREQREEKARKARVDEQVRRIESRFAYHMAGNIAGDISERGGYGVCHPPQWPYARFENAEFRKRASKRVLGAIEKWEPEKLPTLLLAAPTGSGKSAGLLAWLWRERSRLIARAQGGEENVAVSTFLWATGPELAVARRNASLGEEAPLIRYSLDCALLIMDELGFEKLTEVPFEIIDHRYRRGGVTVVTTGLKPAEFRARYGDAMYRRLTEGGAVVEDFPE